MAVQVTRAGVALTVGIILVTGLIIGGLFWVKNAGEQARREEAINIAEQNLEDQSNEEVTLNDESSENESSNDTSANQSEATNNTDELAESGVSTQSPESLPETGPVDTLVTLLAIGVLTYGAIAYWQSRNVSLSNL